MKRVIWILALLFAVTAQARDIRSWQELGVYVGEQTAKLNELQAKLRFQQGLIDEQAGKIALYKETINQQRVWIVDYACKWNKLLAELSVVKVLPPTGPPKSVACDGVSPAPQWPATLP